MHDTLMESIYENATAISRKAVIYPDKKPAFSFDRTLDRILTSKHLGFSYYVSCAWSNILGNN